METEFIQHVNFHVFDQEQISGRIYLNDTLITQRSETESRLISALDSVMRELNDPIEQKMIKEKLTYVQSENYLTDREKIKWG